MLFDMFCVLMWKRKVCVHKSSCFGRFRTRSNFDHFPTIRREARLNFFSRPVRIACISGNVLIYPAVSWRTLIYFFELSLSRQGMPTLECI